MIKRKFGNTPTVVDGIKFASKAEARIFGELRLLERSGQIERLEAHPKFQLFGVHNTPLKIRSDGFPNGRSAVYTADFSYWEKGVWTVVDVKGGKATATEAFKIRRAILEAMHPTMKFVIITT